jgi:hypothetical protein
MNTYNFAVCDNMSKRKILVWMGYVIAFAMWFIIEIVLDYFSHMGEDIPLEP